MADINKLKPIILKWEGGFANDPIDKGGATNKGITLNTFIFYRKLKKLPIPTVDDLKNISEAEWTNVFKSLFWDKWQADRINNQSIANILVDWYWGSGAWGIKIPQRLLNIPQDGIVGNQTVLTLNGVIQEDLFNRIKEARIVFVNNICLAHPEQKKFINGWVNRIESFKFES